MSNTLTGRKVSVLKMHGPGFIAGMGNIPETLKREGGKLGNIEMTLIVGGVHFKNGSLEAYIPDAMIQMATLAPEEPKSDKK